MNVEEGPPPNAPPSELVSQKSSMKKWLIVFGVVSVVGIAAGLSLYFIPATEKTVAPEALPSKAVLVLSNLDENNVPMVIRFNGESHEL